MRQLLCGSEGVQEVALDLLHSCQGPDHWVFDQTILKGVPGIYPFLLWTNKVVADAVRVRVVEARQVIQKRFALSLKSGAGVQTKIQKGGPEDIRQRHQ